MARARNTSRGGRARRLGNTPASSFGKRELVFVSQPSAGLRLGTSGFESTTSANVRGLSEILSAEDVTVRPLFGMSEERIRNRTAALDEAPELPDMGTFYHVEAPDERLDELAETLRGLDEVEGAYVKPAGEPPIAEAMNAMEPTVEEPPATTPNFVARQIHLNPAPAGIHAQYAWQFPGGHGAGVRIIDCEWGWRFTHEDLIQNQGGVVIGTNHTDDNHGTAVLGEFSGDRNTFGIVGICSDAQVSAASFLTLPTATVIRQAADRLQAGDVILLEIHRAGPDASGVGQDGYIAIEWWPDDYAAIRYAVARGIIVVEAGGNGARNLDAAIYNQRPTGFPTTWKNPFNTANPSSRAVVVGAGAPPPGTHGRDHGPDRSRLEFSNYGLRVDVQGWGREVTTTGYGDLQGGATRDLWYTDQFSGTSSASPIIVGTVGCVQGILRARHKPLLTSDSARALLRSTGSPQQDAPGRPRTQRIGNRPDLRQLVSRVLGISPEENIEVESEKIGHRMRHGEEHLAKHDGQVVINVGSQDVTINVRN